jgi:hypothetical protein
MADNLSIDRRTSALLVMDSQTLIVDNYAAGASHRGLPVDAVTASYPSHQQAPACSAARQRY